MYISIQKSTKEEFVIKYKNNMRLLFILLMFPFISFGQIEMNKFYLYGKGSIGKVDTAIYSNLSFSGEYLVHKNIGLNYSFEFMHRNDQIFQFHTTMGVVAGPLLFVVLATNSAVSVNSSGSKFLLAALAFALPDGVSFHIPYRYHWDFSPYINFLGFDYVKYKNLNYHQFKYASSFGFKTSYWTESNLTFLAFAETRKVREMGWSIGMGIGIGYTFKPRD